MVHKVDESFKWKNQPNLDIKASISMETVTGNRLHDEKFQEFSELVFFKYILTHVVRIQNKYLTCW